MDCFLTKDGLIEMRNMPDTGVEINKEGMRKYATPGIHFLNNYLFITNTKNRLIILDLQ